MINRSFDFRDKTIVATSERAAELGLAPLHPSRAFATGGINPRASANGHPTILEAL